MADKFLTHTAEQVDGAIDDINNHKSATDNPHSVTAAQVGLGNVDNTSDADKPISTAAQLALEDKVDKIAGKGLSTNDYTDEEKSKVGTAATMEDIKDGKLTGYAQQSGDVAATDKVIEAIGKVEKKADANKTNILSEQAKTTGMTEGGSNYITVNGIRVYVSATAPTGTIPDGSVGVGW